MDLKNQRPFPQTLFFSHWWPGSAFCEKKFPITWQWRTQISVNKSRTETPMAWQVVNAVWRQEPDGKLLLGQKVRGRDQKSLDVKTRPLKGLKILCLPVPSLVSSIQRVNWVAQVVVTKEGQGRIVRYWSCAQLLFTQSHSCPLKLFGTASFDAQTTSNVCVAHCWVSHWYFSASLSSLKWQQSAKASTVYSTRSGDFSCFRSFLSCSPLAPSPLEAAPNHRGGRERDLWDGEFW